MEEEHSCSTLVSNNIIKENHISTKWITFITDPQVLFWRCYPIDYQDQNMVKKKCKGKKKGWKYFMGGFQLCACSCHTSEWSPNSVVRWCSCKSEYYWFSSALQSEGFHVSTDIPSHGTAEGNSLGGPSACAESNLLHWEMVTCCVLRPRPALHITTTIPQAEFRKFGNCQVW